MKKLIKREVFSVALELPPGATVEMARAYIEDALLALRRAQHPDHPMSKFNKKLLDVSHDPMLVP